MTIAELSEQDWKTALDYAGGPVPITTTGCVEAFNRGLLERDDNEDVVFRFDRLPVATQAQIEEGYALVLDYDANRAHRGTAPTGERTSIKSDPRMKVALRYAVEVFGLNRPHQVASWLGINPDYFDDRWFYQAYCDHLLRQGMEHKDIENMLYEAGSPPVSSAYVRSRARRLN